MDRLTREHRSWLMSRVGSKNTQPEMVVRKILHRLGFRFRLHVQSLPGKPDIVLPRHKAVVLVHGCFWHGHRCRKGRLPKTNVKFWLDKQDRNKNNDRTNKKLLRRVGWRSIIVWQCQIKNLSKLETRLAHELGVVAASISRQPEGTGSVEIRGVQNDETRGTADRHRFIRGRRRHEPRIRAGRI